MPQFIHKESDAEQGKPPSTIPHRLRKHGAHGLGSLPNNIASPDQAYLWLEGIRVVFMLFLRSVIYLCSNKG